MSYDILKNEQIDKSEWSRLVQTSSTSTWFQTPEAFMFFSAQKDLFHPFAIAIAEQTVSDERLAIRGVCVGYVTVEKNPLKQFLTRRAIIIGGPCLADDCTNEEVEALMSVVRKQLHSQSIYIETRNFNDYSRWKSAFLAAGFSYIPHLNFHVDTSSVEVIEANLGKSRKRDIKTSIRDGVTIVDLQNEAVSDIDKERMIHEYYVILSNLYKTKVKTPLFPESFFHNLAKHSDGRFLLTVLSDKIIGGTVCVAQQKKCLYEWFVCGRDGEWKSIFPSSCATYAGIRYAAEHNMPRFDMMGAGTPDEAYGVRDFKARFGGKEVEHGRFICITKPLYYRIGVFGVKLLKILK